MALPLGVFLVVLVAIAVVLLRRGGGDPEDRPERSADVPPAEPGAEGMLVTAPGQISPGPPDSVEG